ncbi:lytic transglycosylase [Amylibacter kogurei]|uniref:Lytic transglycosylase n=1 Tax=Paramylibacter kogurei TaxID=1889778 RepID=A0A2G5K569_9RHOB|nr:lytic transglycosylase domain-containing protein [Amylibacter kogurei]PIB24676.1 lytic transglycosylase [Amylibacter kogurei]
MILRNFIATVVSVSILPIAGSATGLSEKHKLLIDKRLSKQYNNSARLLPNSTKINYETIPSYRGKYKGVYKPMAEAAARKHGIPVDLFNRLVQQESNWNPRAKSHAGAIGLAQLMPFTAKTLGVNPRDPEQNLDGGARYLKQQYRKFGSWRLALAAYNAGPGAVEKYSGIPPYRETRNYVKKIMGH